MRVYKMTQAFGLMCITLMFIGCSDQGDTPDLGSVSGTITLDGAPVANAKIIFRPLSGGRISSGVSDDSGAYTLEYKSDTPGAKVDRHQVTVLTGREAQGLPGMEGYVPPVEEMIPQKYIDESELEVEVKAGENTIPLELTN